MYVCICIPFHDLMNLWRILFTPAVKPPWILNTLRNVKTLEKHVGKEVAQFMKENLPQSFDQNSHLENSLEIIKCQSLRQQTTKVNVKTI
jgi:hypothetical protein